MVFVLTLVLTAPPPPALVRPAAAVLQACLLRVRLQRARPQLVQPAAGGHLRGARATELATCLPSLPHLLTPPFLARVLPHLLVNC